MNSRLSCLQGRSHLKPQRDMSSAVVDENPSVVNSG